MAKVDQDLILVVNHANMATADVSRTPPTRTNVIVYQYGTAQIPAM
jgi:hypothetical protein